MRSRSLAPAAAALLLALPLAGCGGSRPPGAIDVASLEHELETVIGLRLVAQNFFHRRVEVTCGESPDHPLLYSCRVNAINPAKPTQSWTEIVSCDPPDAPGRVPDEQRCFSDHGEALQ